MKKLIRRLSRVADSSSSPHYSLLRSESRLSSRRTRASKTTTTRRGGGGVPEGHLPVYVGDEMERFVVSAELLNHPIFINLLNKSAQEYGYEQQGVLRIPCHVILFEQVLEAVRRGCEYDELQLQLLLSADDIVSC
ncbi:SAUR-like auxin-responsive protein family [Artemisia annua]|uniref:SAUR-like auxin-responsive protein family n=1 Tax=Artemisia annua TaxID=35608 RepID=A0A2U1PJE0_ARTAN|nr:SAUR-like auxin-responsive protein family [Artemisia annua]